jgi:hypothetical protein
MVAPLRRRHLAGTSGVLNGRIHGCYKESDMRPHSAPNWIATAIANVGARVGRLALQPVTQRFQWLLAEGVSAMARKSTGFGFDRSAPRRCGQR